MVEIPEKLLLQTGLSKEFVLKEIKVNEVLNALSGMPSDYALYGGTAINKVYIGQKRFSEDIDVFVYGKQRKFTAFAKKVFPGVAGPKRIFRESYRYWAPYSFPEHGVADSVRIDANFNLKKPRTPAESREPGSFLNDYGFFIRNRDVAVLPRTTLAASKLLTLTTRGLGRDYFDAYHLLMQELPPRPELMGEAHKHVDSFFDFLSFREDFLEEALEKIKSADVKELAAADQYILKAYRPDWKELLKTLALKVKRIAGSA